MSSDKRSVNSNVSLSQQGTGMAEHQRLEERGKDVPALANARPPFHHKYHKTRNTPTTLAAVNSVYSHVLIIYALKWSLR